VIVEPLFKRWPFSRALTSATSRAAAARAKIPVPAAPKSIDLSVGPSRVELEKFLDQVANRSD